jgi:hypothetical protein
MKFTMDKFVLAAMILTLYAATGWAGASGPDNRKIVRDFYEQVFIGCLARSF